MATNKNLGMGLDLLLSAIDGRKNEIKLAPALEQARAIFEKALHEDEKGDFLEAYHLYRQVIECMEPLAPDSSPEMCLIVSQALNNAATILFENNQVETAQVYLKRAVKIYPDNQTARENLQLIKL